jgi:hypothetical protein
VLVSNVHLFGAAQHGIGVNGTATWTPGVGVNAPQTNNLEVVSFDFIDLAGQFTFDSTGGASGASGPMCDTC